MYVALLYTYLYLQTITLFFLFAQSYQTKWHLNHVAITKVDEMIVLFELL